MKHVFCLFLSISLSTWCGLKAQNEQLTIGLAGNAYVTSHPQGARITEEGLTQWSDPQSVISVYFYLSEPGELELALNASGHSTLKVSYEKQQKTVRLSSDTLATVRVGQLKVKHPGYVRIDMHGVRKEKQTFGCIKDILLSGVKGEANYVTNFSNYWGRRGPSVHLGYKLPEGDTEWFYSEVKVPREGEVMNSYYMAAGFGEGYFGMQYNSPTERRVLFSVWSPFDTQDPTQIPEEDKIRLLKRGEGVHIGEFGNEGSGGQSFLRYPWKADQTYRFLMHVRPDGSGSTVYTAYFFATEENQWRLIASFLRPKTNTWYTNAHSFLENFHPDQGYLSRKVLFTNQWALGKDGTWREVTKARFTHDATAAARVRLDFRGGMEQGSDQFYLQMGGFFDGFTTLGTLFERTPNGRQPVVDLETLNAMTNQ